MNPPADQAARARAHPAAKHIVWDWNGTLLDDVELVVAATNASLATAGAGPTTVDEHRRDFVRPVHAYYGRMIGHELTRDEFAALDRAFHAAYSEGLAALRLASDALACLTAWTGTQSLLSMWFHRELVPTVARYGLTSYFARIDGLKATVGGGSKAPHLAAHLQDLGLRGDGVVLIGDSLDDADAAASVGAGCVLYAGGLTHPDKLAAVGLPVARTLTDALALATTLYGG